MGHDKVFIGGVHTQTAMQSYLVAELAYRVPLFNHRGNLKVVFLRHKEDKLKSVLATSPDAIEVQNPYEPLRIHLALTANPRHERKSCREKPRDFCHHTPLRSLLLLICLNFVGH